jgi:hypothetical protein
LFEPPISCFIAPTSPERLDVSYDPTRFGIGSFGSHVAEAQTSASVPSGTGLPSPRPPAITWFGSGWRAAGTLPTAEWSPRRGADRLRGLTDEEHVTGINPVRIRNQVFDS